MSKKSIKIAIVGIGNCASSIIQGLHYYKNNPEETCGLINKRIGSYTINDIELVAAFDVDVRKIGLPVTEAIFCLPNCSREFVNKKELSNSYLKNIIVTKGNVLDGVSNYMLEQPEEIGFKIGINASEEEKLNIEKTLIDSGAEILINYCPVGSQLATEYYASVCLKTGISLLNCIPVFIASNPIWDKKFEDANIPIIGDDMKSQFGASILSQILQELALDRGHEVEFHSQINIGGNTDFNNMMVHDRLKSKKKSKENVITSQNELRGLHTEKHSVFAGPSTFVPYLKDNKIAHLNLLLNGFGRSPVELDIKLSVQDSENSSGIVIDAIRYLKIARDKNLSGSIKGPSAFTQKTPPVDLSFKDSLEECEKLSKQ